MSRASDAPSIEVLLVEDCADDAELMVVALRDGQLALRVTVVEDGEQALDYLHRQGDYSTVPRPDLILLDLYLPRKNGHEVLAEIKQDAVLRRIPVVIMTAPENEKSFPGLYDLHANCCVAKPANQEQFALAVRKIEQFWLHTARRP